MSGIKILLKLQNFWIEKINKPTFYLDFMIPPKLRQGDKIRVISPSRSLDIISKNEHR